MQRDIVTKFESRTFYEGAAEFRERCAEILLSAAAEGRFEQAKTLALDTDIPAEPAIALLAAAPLDRDLGASPGMGIADEHAAAAWADAAANVQ
jgi:hypothetical protein